MKEQTIIFWSVVSLFISVILMFFGIRQIGVLLFIVSAIIIYFAKDIAKFTKKLKD